MAEEKKSSAAPKKTTKSASPKATAAQKAAARMNAVAAPKVESKPEVEAVKPAVKAAETPVEPAIKRGMAIGMLESLLSVFLFGRNELYLGSVLVLAAMVAIFIKYPNVHYPSWLLSLTGCSTYIHIFHPILPGILGRVYGVLGIQFHESVAVQIVHPIIVCILATVLAVWLGKLTQKNRLSWQGKDNGNIE